MGRFVASGSFRRESADGRPSQHLDRADAAMSRTTSVRVIMPSGGDDWNLDIPVEDSVMAVYFNFVATDPEVTSYLTTTQIGGVQRWQNTALDYDFSFHEAHEAGCPVYVCKSDSHGQRNMPKIDTKNKTTAQMVNAIKLSNAQRDDAIAVVNANWCCSSTWPSNTTIRMTMPRSWCRRP